MGASAFSGGMTGIFDNVDSGKKWYKGVATTTLKSGFLAKILPFDKLVTMAGVPSNSVADAFINYVVQAYEGAVDVSITIIEKIIENLSQPDMGSVPCGK